MKQKKQKCSRCKKVIKGKVAYRNTKAYCQNCFYYMKWNVSDKGIKTISEMLR